MPDGDPDAPAKNPADVQSINALPRCAESVGVPDA